MGFDNVYRPAYIANLLKPASEIPSRLVLRTLAPFTASFGSQVKRFIQFHVAYNAQSRITVHCIVVKFKTFRIKFKKVQKSSRKNKVHKSS